MLLPIKYILWSIQVNYHQSTMFKIDVRKLVQPIKIHSIKPKKKIHH